MAEKPLSMTAFEECLSMLFDRKIKMCREVQSSDFLAVDDLGMVCLRFYRPGLPCIQETATGAVLSIGDKN